jgi:hypothetical protein
LIQIFSLHAKIEGGGAMGGWLKSLQKREMYEAAKNVMIAWSLICAWALIIGLSRVADINQVVAREFSRVITMEFWLTVWAYPLAGLGIIAFVTRPRKAVH